MAVSKLLILRSRPDWFRLENAGTSLNLTIPGAEPYKRDLNNIEFHLLDTGHFALEEDGDVIADRMRQFLTTHVLSAE